VGENIEGKIREAKAGYARDAEDDTNLEGGEQSVYHDPSVAQLTYVLPSEGPWSWMEEISEMIQRLWIKG